MLLMAISACAPALPKKLLKPGADAAYVRSLSIITTLLAIVTVPISLAALGSVFRQGCQRRDRPGCGHDHLWRFWHPCWPAWWFAPSR